MPDEVLDEVNALINFFEGDEMMDEELEGLMDICQNLSDKLSNLDTQTIVENMRPLFSTHQIDFRFIVLLMVHIFSNKKFRARYSELFDAILGMEQFMAAERELVCRKFLEIMTDGTNYIDFLDLVTVDPEPIAKHKEDLQNLMHQFETKGPYEIKLAPGIRGFDLEKNLIITAISSDLYRFRQLFVVEEFEILKEVIALYLRFEYQLPDSMVRYAIKWLVPYADDKKQFILDNLTKNKFEGRVLKRYYFLGALDALELADLTHADLEEILEIGREHPLGDVRRRAYELGYKYLGADFVKPAFHDKAEKVVKIAQTLLGNKD